MKTNGESGGDFYGWGREVLATGCGTVVYSRNDVPDNIRPGETDVNLFSKLPDPLWAIGGNSIVIDHGNGESSFLAHMQKGSIRVKAGDTVQQGQVIGLLGSPGHADAAHGLIVGAAVTDAANDTAQLLPAVDRLEQRLNKRPQQMVADRGYTTRENIEKMAAENQFSGNHAVCATGANLPNQLPPSAFLYQPERNRCVCPAGKILHKQRQRKVGAWIITTSIKYGLRIVKPALAHRRVVQTTKRTAVR